MESAPGKAYAAPQLAGSSRACPPGLPEPAASASKLGVHCSCCKRPTDQHFILDFTLNTPSIGSVCAGAGARLLAAGVGGDGCAAADGRAAPRAAAGVARPGRSAGPGEHYLKLNW